MSSVVEIPVDHLNEYPALSRLLVDLAGDARHVLFYGPMGAGKTTFIKDLCAVLGGADNFSSPTYAIVNEYKSEGGPLYHFDLYRLKDRSELLDIGVEDYLSSGNWCFFEWPELVEDLVDKAYVKVQIENTGTSRFIKISKS